MPEARSAGYASVYALPMRLRQQVIGSLNLLRRAAARRSTTPGSSEAQALADVATIGILQHRAAAEQRLLAQQLQYALQSRILVEQAKGVLAEYAGSTWTRRSPRSASTRGTTTSGSSTSPAPWWSGRSRRARSPVTGPRRSPVLWSGGAPAPMVR